MPNLTMTFLDVGWGDSILIQVDDPPKHHFALIDSNDTTNCPVTRVFLKRYFERYADRAGLTALPYPLFESVIASHSHADHSSGLRRVIQVYGANHFLFPRFNQQKSAGFARLVNWSSKSTRNHQPVTNNRRFIAHPDTFSIGPVDVSVLRPPAPPMGLPNVPHDPHNENNNSLVLAFRLGDVIFVTTGDCEADNWRQPASGGGWPVPLPSQFIKIVQVPHHGASNGLFDAGGNAPMLDQIRDLQRSDRSVSPLLAVSCHPKPFNHPDPAVAAVLDSTDFGGRFTGPVAGLNWLRTDKNLHYSVKTDGATIIPIARPMD